MKVSNLKRQEHIDRLAREMGCQVRQAPKLAGMMYVEAGYVEGPDIVTQRDYFALLHELGHFALGHTQGRPPYSTQRYYFDHGVLRCEAEAWEFVLNESEEIPEYKTRRFMWDYCLGGYYQHALEIGAEPTRLPHGNRHHVEFVFDKADDFFASVVAQIQEGAQGFLIPFPGKLTMEEWTRIDDTVAIWLESVDHVVPGGGAG